MQALGERIKEAREMAGMTREALGEGVGVSPASLALYEGGESFPEARMLQRLSEATKCNIDYLVYGVERPKPRKGLAIALARGGYSSAEVADKTGISPILLREMRAGRPVCIPEGARDAIKKLLGYRPDDVVFDILYFHDVDLDNIARDACVRYDISYAKAIEQAVLIFILVQAEKISEEYPSALTPPVRKNGD